MKYLLFCFSVLVLMAACQTEQPMPQSNYPRWVGDIAFDETLDNPNFELCNGDDNVFQYHNVANGIQYQGEKKDLIEAFNSQYKPVKMSGQSGLIRIRFVVNCQGKTDRFRLLGADENWQPFTFDAQITDQLMAIAKRLGGWKILDLDGLPLDYYQYLVFKMKDGEIEMILP